MTSRAQGVGIWLGARQLTVDMLSPSMLSK